MDKNLKYKYIILGAGPAGLTLANLLRQNCEVNFLLLEAENEAGGLCRSQMVDGSPLDIGGGHFLDVRNPKVNDFLFQFLPADEWNMFIRNSQIKMGENYIMHPIEANIWQLDIDEQIEYLVSIAQAGANQGTCKPQKFIDWIYWKLGKKIAEDYMIPYNSKIFSKNLNELGTYWLEKLPNVSFTDTLRSCLEHKAYGEQPGHAQFYYPKKYGYGEVWRRMAESVSKQIRYNKKVCCIDFLNNSVKCSDGSVYFGSKIITSIPWNSISHFVGMPDKLINKINDLKHSAIEICYYSENLDSNAHWIYDPDINTSYHRILLRHNFVPNGKGIWTETNCDRIEHKEKQFSYINEYAYPLNTINKPDIMKEIISWARTKNVYPIGRWGEHEHYNSDVTVLKAMELFNRIYEE